MKLRIEGYSCTEDVIFDAICDAKALIEALKLEWIEIKVFKDVNRQGGHDWLKVSKDSSIHDMMTIYKLQQQLKELESKTLKP